LSQAHLALIKPAVKYCCAAQEQPVCFLFRLRQPVDVVNRNPSGSREPTCACPPRAVRSAFLGNSRRASRTAANVDKFTRWSGGSADSGEAGGTDGGIAPQRRAARFSLAVAADAAGAASCGVSACLRGGPRRGVLAMRITLRRASPHARLCPGVAAARGGSGLRQLAGGGRPASR
jgi:hypothetical protein